MLAYQLLFNLKSKRNERKGEPEGYFLQHFLSVVFDTRQVEGQGRMGGACGFGAN